MLQKTEKYKISKYRRKNNQNHFFIYEVLPCNPSVKLNTSNTFNTSWASKDSLTQKMTERIQNI